MADQLAAILARMDDRIAELRLDDYAAEALLLARYRPPFTAAIADTDAAQVARHRNRSASPGGLRGLH